MLREIVYKNYFNDNKKKLVENRKRILCENRVISSWSASDSDPHSHYNSYLQ